MTTKSYDFNDDGNDSGGKDGDDCLILVLFCFFFFKIEVRGSGPRKGCSARFSP